MKKDISDTAVTVRMPSDMLQLLNEVAVAQDRSVSYIIKQYVRVALAMQKPTSEKGA